ncbi:MAG: hypothetical protein U0X93_02705 [Anaerolineales bacterium]
MFLFIVVPAIPLAIIILPTLLGLTYLGLRWNRLTEADGSMLTNFNNPVPAWKYLSLLGIPVAGVSFYALAALLNFQWHTNWVLYLITTPLGFILFGISLYKLRKRKSVVSTLS